ncbi:MAG: hypothetical protein AAF231_02230 [Pseudomonadota bacterium]
MSLDIRATRVFHLILKGQEIEAGAVMALNGGPALIKLVGRRRELRVCPS